MTEKLQLYRCEICGNLVEVVIAGEGELVCCGQPMHLVTAKDKDTEGLEKHVPVFSKTTDGGREIRIGSVLHPMNDDHYIMFAEVISKDEKRLHRRYFSPGEDPIEKLEKFTGKAFAREFCSIHGLWEGESD